MVKSIIKEIIIMLLLLLAIILALGILLYDYIPNNKVIPTVDTYTTSTEITNELETNISNDETINVIYEITANDLKSLEKTNEYEKGKANPFGPIVNPISQNTNENTNVADGNTVTQGNNNNNNNNNTFYKNTGTK